MIRAAQKNLDIQLLRGVAIVLVMMQHYRGRMPTPAVYNELFSYVSFWPGVDIFFAISGFLICRTFLRDLAVSQTGHEAIVSFWLRRVARLLPASVFWCLASVAAAGLVTTWPGADVLDVAKSAVFGIFGVSNLYWASCVQHALQCGSADFNGVTWSLALEWQLYALITLLMWAAGVRRAIIVMAVLAIAVSIFAAPSFSYVWVLRPQSFTMGAIVFLCTRARHIGGSKLFCAFAPIVLLVSIAVCIGTPVHVPQPFVLPAISIGAAACLMCTIHGNVLTAWVPTSCLVWIGERSYSIYLCHLPIFLLARELLARTIGIDPSPLTVIAGLIGSLGAIAVCAHLSYRYVELPFQRMGHGLMTRHPATAS